jgi:hypothetical protein
MSDWMAGMTDFQREEVARMESRAHSCEARFESLHLDEIDWKKERKQLRVDLAAAIKERDEARRWLREACAEIARTRLGFYDTLTPQQIAEQNGWNCFAQEGGGA